MKVDKISRLFDPTETVVANPASQPNAPAAQAAPVNEEAVRVASNFGEKQAAKVDETGRFESIKQQVQSGSYKVDSKKVAEALMRDLF